MPEHLHPGVYVEEIPFRSKPIEGVSTSTTALVGPTRYGPTDLKPDVITSLVEFERVYGDSQQLNFSDAGTLHNYMWHAVRAFFEEGGTRLYIARVFEKNGTDSGKAGATLSDGSPRAAPSVTIEARFPGKAGNVRITIIVRKSPNVLPKEGTAPIVKSLQNRDVVWIGGVTSPMSSSRGEGDVYLALRDGVAGNWTFQGRSGTLALTNLNPDEGHTVQVITMTIVVDPTDEHGLTTMWEGLAVDPLHVQDGATDAFLEKFAATPSSLAEERTLPVVVTPNGVSDGLQMMSVLFAQSATLEKSLSNPSSTDKERSVTITLDGGSDGNRPSADTYQGAVDPSTHRKTGLVAIEDIEEISIVAAPGSTFGFEKEYRNDAETIVSQLIAHATHMKYRIAILDSGDDQSIAQVRAMRGKIDSAYAALYYPWVTVLDPVTKAEIPVPPSGHVAGIYARNDTTRAVFKAPTNEIVSLATGFEPSLSKGQQEVLNPEGINCFRFFPGRGFRLWGARTISSDPEFKYVNIRRYFAYLGHSIDKGTQWAVFEPNGEALWRNVRETIQDFLFTEWRSGALLGDDPRKAFFVKCDRSTMTQTDLDNGRLICLIGVAVVKPAEFVIFKIGQWTADRKV